MITENRILLALVAILVVVQIVQTAALVQLPKHPNYMGGAIWRLGDAIQLVEYAIKDK
jgi:uncharacterized membrane protein